MEDEKIYVVDTQDLSDVQELTLDETKDFLIGMWQEDTREAREHVEDVKKADMTLLSRYLSGVGYALFDDIDEFKEFKKMFE